jgi:hypothetical protein
MLLGNFKSHASSEQLTFESARAVYELYFICLSDKLIPHRELYIF